MGSWLWNHQAYSGSSILPGQRSCAFAANSWSFLSSSDRHSRRHSPHKLVRRKGPFRNVSVHAHTRSLRLRQVCAAERTPWDILGVRPGNDKDLKRAYKAKARQLHPDVNKAADASARFMECRQAYITLTDPRLRAEYDRKSQGAGDWEAWSGSASSRVRKAAEDTFYGFTEFFRDLDADLKARRAKRDQQPRSLWEELADIGEEFVEFLEGATRASSPQASTAKQRSQEAASRTTKDADRKASEATHSAEVAASKAQKEAADEVEQMLQELKRNLRQ